MGEPVDAERLRERLEHYAKAAGASEAACRQMLDMLQSPLGKAVLALPQQQLDSLLVNDMYKLRMQNMYSQFMTGVAADFALKIRRISGGDGSATPATVLSDMPQQQPQIYSALMERVCVQLQQLQPLEPRVLDALQEFHSGWQPPEAMLSRLSANGVAPISWVDINGSPVAIGSGPIKAASNTETSCMQAVQAAVIAAGAAKATAAAAAATAAAAPATCGPASIAPAAQQLDQPSAPSANAADSTAPAADKSEHSSAAAAAAAFPASGFVLDRTERLACSLGHMAGVVEAINETGHDFDILLMAGRRSTDLLHLLLQNLYFMKHARNYIGTSSVLVCALLRPLTVDVGMCLQQRQQLVKGLLGTHAHEMSSMAQQLLAGYDQEAGRRCGLKVPVCISQCLAHLLFMAANGDQTPTALPDTFGTPYFVRVALLLQPPAEFLQDMQQRWGVAIESGSKVFDLFRVWRMDSGDYPTLAQLILDAWQQRCKERQAAGLQALPRPQLMHSNISSVDDIRKLAALPEQLRPHTLGFGGLADGFLPFDAPSQQQQQQQAAECAPGAAVQPTAASAAGAVDAVTAALAAQGLDDSASGPVITGHGRSSSVSSAASVDSMIATGTGSNSSSSAAADSSSSSSGQAVTLPICSLVMKAVQARLSSSSSSSSAQMPGTAVAAAAAGVSEEIGGPYPYAASLPPAAADACGSSNSSCYSSCLSEEPEFFEEEEEEQQQQLQQQQQCRMRLGSLQESAVKLGDGSSLSKAQVDPRLPAETQKEVLGRVQAMVSEGLAALGQRGLGSEAQGAALSEVLREAYVAVVRQGLLNLA